MLTYSSLGSLGSLLARFGLAAVICLLSVADKARSSDFDLLPDLDLACHFLRIKNKNKSTRSEFSIVASLRTLVPQLGMGGKISPPPTLPQRVCSVEFPSGARVNVRKNDGIQDRISFMSGADRIFQRLGQV